MFFAALAAVFVVVMFATAQTPTTQPSHGQQSVKYCLTGTATNTACLQTAQADPNTASYCPPGETWTLQNCGMNSPSQTCVNAATGAQGSYCTCYGICKKPKAVAESIGELE